MKTALIYLFFPISIWLLIGINAMAAYYTSSTQALSAAKQHLQAAEASGQQLKKALQEYQRVSSAIDHLLRQQPNLAREIDQKIDELENKTTQFNTIENEFEIEHQRWFKEYTLLQNKIWTLEKEPRYSRDIDVKISKFDAKIQQLELLKITALQELREGKFCSECRRPASQIKLELNEEFTQHLGRVQGHPIPMPKKEIDKKERNFDKKIENLETQKSRLEQKKELQKKQYSEKLEQARNKLHLAGKIHDQKIEGLEEKKQLAKEWQEIERNSQLDQLETKKESLQKKFRQKQAALKNRQDILQDHIRKLRSEKRDAESELFSAKLQAEMLIWQEEAEQKRLQAEKQKELRNEQRKIEKEKRRAARELEKLRKKSKAGRKKRQPKKVQDSIKRQYNTEDKDMQTDKARAIQQAEQHLEDKNDQERLAKKKIQEAALEKDRMEKDRQRQRLEQEKLARDFEPFAEQLMQNRKRNTIFSRENSGNKQRASFNGDKTGTHETEPVWEEKPGIAEPLQQSQKTLMKRLLTITQSFGEKLESRITRTANRHTGRLDHIWETGKQKLDTVKAHYSEKIEELPEKIYLNFISHGKNALLARVGDAIQKAAHSLTPVNQVKQYLKDRIHDQLARYRFEQNSHKRWEDLSGFEQDTEKLLYNGGRSEHPLTFLPRLFDSLKETTRHWEKFGLEKEENEGLITD